MAGAKNKRSAVAGSSKKAPKRIKKTDDTKHAWAKGEEVAIANFVSERPYLGKNQAKTTLIQYLRRMVKELNLRCTDRQIANKYDAMKKAYEKTRNWINETGQGVEDDDPISFPDKVKEQCHYYYLLDTVFGTSQAFNTSYQRDSGEERFGDEDPIIDDNKSLCSQSDDVQSGVSLISDNPATGQVTIAAKRFEAALQREKAKPGRLSGSEKIQQLLESRQQQRCEVELMKLNWEKEKWSAEHAQLIEIKKQELELEFKKAQLAQQVDLKKLELEERKLNFKMEKFKATNSNA